MLDLKSSISYLTEILNKSPWKSKDLALVINYLIHIEIRLKALTAYKKNSKKNIRDLQRALDRERSEHKETRKSLEWTEKRYSKELHKVWKLEEDRCKLCEETAKAKHRARMEGGKLIKVKKESRLALKTLHEHLIEHMEDLDPECAKTLEDNFWDLLA